MKRSSGGSGDALAQYHAKRHFETTSEPRGGQQGKTQGYSFVIQKHDARRLHYDFRLELDGVLKSWAVTRGPSLDPTQKRLAVRVEDHPLDYGGFEGTIPQGQYGGGTVMLWDRGNWSPEGDPHQGLAAGKLAFTLSGEKLTGKWALVRMRKDARDKRENWLLIKERDAVASAEREVLDDARSVASGRSLDEIAGAAPAAPARTGPERSKKAAAKIAASLADFVEPSLATLVDAPPGDSGWVYEIKYDGYRAQIAADGAFVRIYSRSGLDWTERFDPIAQAVAARKLGGVLIDAEIVVLDGEGRSDFGLLQHWFETGDGSLACFAFDLLVENRHDIRKQPLSVRTARLAALLDKDDGWLFLSAPFEPDAPADLLGEICRRGLEGLIAKRADAPYRSGRHSSWLKIKCGHQQEFVVIGWSPSKKRPFSSLLLAVSENGALRYAGRVGSGFSDRTLENLSRTMVQLEKKTPPIALPAAIARHARFVGPQIVVEIRFAGWTRDNLIRQGHLLGIREDKPATAVTREIPATPPLRFPRSFESPEPRATPPDRTPAPARPTNSERDTIAGIALSHPDKPLYRDPDITKADLAFYLDAVGDIMAPYAAGRFCSLLRCPRGQGKPGFFQRHPHAGLERYWKSRPLASKSDREAYLYFDDRRALIEAAQMDTLEFHIWGSRADDPERPDRIVFDLDPAPDVDFAAVRTGAREIRDVLAALGLDSLPLISGGKGIHVVAPIARSDWPTVKQFASRVAARLAQASPDRYVATMTKAKRKGRIFIDFFRNDLTASAIAPFSPRNRPGAPVAWPAGWATLDSFDAADSVSIFEAQKRLAGSGDPWRDYRTIKQSLTRRMIDAMARE